MTEAGGEKLVIPCEVYSRIVGYLRPVQAWNAGKRQEFADRVLFRPAEVERPAPREVEAL